MKISAVVITYNEERNIARCIESLLPVADEVLVLDSGSADATQSIASQLGARVEEHAFDGHIQQKNRAVQLAKHDMVLSLDADEALTEELQHSILAVKSSAREQAFSFNRLTYYCGHWVRHCGWYPDKKLRLWNRKIGRWGGVNPHDRVEVERGMEIKHLQGDLLHYSYYSQEDHLKQIDYFSDIASREAHALGKKSNWLIIAVKVSAQYIKSLVIKLGFLDGKTGFTISRLSACATYRKYYKLMQLNHA